MGLNTVMPESFNVNSVDVVVADEEDICRAAAANALQRFGVRASRVHEAESSTEALMKVAALQTAVAAVNDRTLPIIVLLAPGLDCARQIYDMFAAKKLQREPFLVCASSRRDSQTNNRTSAFHCFVPKTFETSKLSDCFDSCRSWWQSGGGAPGVRSRVIDAGTPIAETPLAATPVAPTRVIKVAPAKEARPKSHSPSPAALVPKGKSIESLDFLQPAKAAFEDVRMVSLAGRGSFGRVYKARWEVSTVALKVVEHYQDSDPALAAFEGALSASLAHPNLVQTFKHNIRAVKSTNGKRESGALDGVELWIVQEWCGLGTLSRKLSKKKLVEQGSFAEAIEVAAEIGSACSYLHSRGIIHGDLTASNVLLSERQCAKGYTAKVSDFGLARVLDKGVSAINTATMGTVTYMPPELFSLGGCLLTKKVDVYAFGVILWQLLTSGIPFEGLQATQVVVMVAQGATLTLPPSVPEPLGSLWTQTVARVPSDRPGFEKIVRDLLAMADMEEKQ